MRREWRSTRVEGIFACKVQPWGKLMQTAVDAGPTRNAQLILEIVDGIYAAAGGEATWDQLLARICRLGRLDGAALGTVGADEPQRILLAAFGLDPRTNRGALRGATAHGWRPVDSLFPATPGTVLREPLIMSEPPTPSLRRAVSAPVHGASAMGLCDRRQGWAPGGLA
jgi:hypothetical protein